MPEGVTGSMARVLIIYDTRYGSTKTIAEWIAEGAASKYTWKWQYRTLPKLIHAVSTSS